MGKLYPVEQVMKGCPFCGGEAAIIEGGDRFYVCCGNIECYCSLGEGWDRDAMSDHLFPDQESAITAWNTRIEATPAVDREGAEAGIRIAIWNAARAAGIGQDMAITLVQKAMEQPAIIALHPVKQSDGLAERVREACAKVAENTPRQYVFNPAEGEMKALIASAIRSLDITRMDSES